MKPILITGGAGYIGANLAKRLLSLGHTVVIIDNFSSGHWTNLIHIDCEVQAAECDDADLLAQIAQGEFQAIFHQAAITDTTVMDQNLMVQKNTNAFASILKASAASDTRVIYASSAGVYGNSEAPNALGVGEIPENIYGFSKLAMDRIAKKWYDKHPCPIVGLRYFNVYGPGEAHKNQHKQKTASMILQLYQQIKAKQTLRLFKYGEQKRDFVYIEDVIDANIAALTGTKSGVANVGSGYARSFNDIVHILGETLKVSLDVEFIDNPFPFFQTHTQADMQGSILDWTPAWSLEKGITHYINILESTS
ncbi:MAG: ADP-glyceromanno-heptose 6-epimerase [Mariprofundaceae bacterium]|nr:ADP-glyceromanno-heptose 6-epimerase [Mariprofundaceae bacterium]